MAEYIEREKMLEDLRLQFCKGCINYSEIKCKSCSVDDVIGFIEDLPTADVVEVVRCKDCKYFVLHGLACIYPHHNGWCSVNHYCGFGERRCEE